MSVNPLRGEAALTVGGETLKLRPSFAALVAAEDELGPLFALVERAAEGRLKLSEIAALFDHVSADGRPPSIDRARIGEAVLALGMTGVAIPLRTLLGEIIKGR